MAGRGPRLARRDRGTGRRARGSPPRGRAWAPPRAAGRGPGRSPPPRHPGRARPAGRPSAPFPVRGWASWAAWVLDPPAALASALMAVEVRLCLLGAHTGYEAARLVQQVPPERYLPLRAVAMHFHASMEGMAAA